MFSITANQFFSSVVGITNTNMLKELSARTTRRVLRKGEFIIHAGEVQNHIWLLEKGCARGFFTAKNGSEVTDCIIFRPGSSAMGHSNLEAESLSLISIQCMENSSFFLIPIPVIQILYEKYEEIKQLHNSLLLDALNAHWKLKQILTQYSAAERYQWFLCEYPGLIDRIQKKHIASFIGMTPVTLSRIRTKLKNQGGGWKLL